jgi:hypothetical protein
MPAFQPLLGERRNAIRLAFVPVEVDNDKSGAAKMDAGHRVDAVALPHSCDAFGVSACGTRPPNLCGLLVIAWKDRKAGSRESVRGFEVVIHARQPLFPLIGR